MEWRSLAFRRQNEFAHLLCTQRIPCHLRFSHVRNRLLDTKARKSLPSPNLSGKSEGAGYQI